MTAGGSLQPSGPQPRDLGESLIELLISIMIMGVAVVALLGGIATGVRMSDIHRKQAKANAFVRAFAEAVETAVAASPSAYADCADTDTYGSAYSVPDANYSAQITAVDYWNGAAFVKTCIGGADSGVQRVSLSVSSNDGATTETVDVIIRKPCRLVDDFPLDAPCT